MFNFFDMKAGDKIPCILEVVREMDREETVMLNGKPEVINNFRCNKYWAVPYRCSEQGKEILVCIDVPETEAQITRRNALVALIEGGS